MPHDPHCTQMGEVYWARARARASRSLYDTGKVGWRRNGPYMVMLFLSLGIANAAPLAMTRAPSDSGNATLALMVGLGLVCAIFLVTDLRWCSWARKQGGRVLIGGSVWAVELRLSDIRSRMEVLPGVTRVVRRGFACRIAHVPSSWLPSDSET